MKKKITEGKMVKGGVNNTPQGKRPPNPKGQSEINENEDFSIIDNKYLFFKKIKYVNPDVIVHVQSVLKQDFEKKFFNKKTQKWKDNKDNLLYEDDQILIQYDPDKFYIFFDLPDNTNENIEKGVFKVNTKDYSNFMNINFL